MLIQQKSRLGDSGATPRVNRNCKIRCHLQPQPKLVRLELFVVGLCELSWASRLHTDVPVLLQGQDTVARHQGPPRHLREEGLASTPAQRGIKNIPPTLGEAVAGV